MSDLRQQLQSTLGSAYTIERELGFQRALELDPRSADTRNAYAVALTDLGQRLPGAARALPLGLRGGRWRLPLAMDRVAQRLAARDTFIRVRRSAIINLRAVATLERYAKSAFVVRLRNGTKIITSRYYQPTLRRLLRPNEI